MRTLPFCAVAVSTLRSAASVSESLTAVAESKLIVIGVSSSAPVTVGGVRTGASFALPTVTVIVLSAVIGGTPSSVTV